MQVTVGNGETVCQVAGEIDMATGSRLEDALSSLVAPDVSCLVLELGGVTFMDSSGLRLLIVLHQAMEAQGGQLVVRNPSGTVMRLLEITNLTHQLCVEP
jgi:anti-anti-sigma factor